MNRNNRADHKPGIRQEYERHKRRILATETVCGICGQPVDKALKYPHPGSPTIDHIIPISRGGHPSALENLQLAHFKCNRMKYNQLELKAENECFMDDKPQPYKGLPWSVDWTAYQYEEAGDISNISELWQKAERIRQTGFMISIEGIVKKH